MTQIRVLISYFYSKYLKLSIRYLFKKKLYSLINIIGMAVSFSAVILLSIYLIYEYDTDKHFSQYSDLYRLNRGDNCGLAIPLNEYIESEFSEFESICRVQPAYSSVLEAETKNITNENGYYVDSTVFNFFDIQIISGDKNQFHLPRSIFLSESLSETLFGIENPIGKAIELEGKYELIVRGLYEDIPGNSHLVMEFLIPIATMAMLDDNAKRQYKEFEQWGCSFYVILRDGRRIKELDSRLNAYIKEVRDNDQWEMHIQPLADIYFDTEQVVDKNKHGNKKQLYVLFAVAAGILILSSINYFNLSTATSVSRSREIGLKKMFGARRKSIALQFLLETFLIISISVIIGFLLAELLMPYFNNLYGLNLKVGALYAGKYLVKIVILSTLLCVITGFYPAIILSGVPIQTVFFKNNTGGKNAKNARALFIVLQYTISIILLISVFTIKHQVNYMMHLNPGFDKDQLVYISYGEEVGDRFEEFKNSLNEYPSILGITKTANVPGQRYWNNIVDIKGERLIFFDCITDPEFANVMGIEMVQGRFIDWSTPLNRSIVINESAQKLLNLDDPIGYKGIWGAPIVGVIKDFHFQSMHTEVKPMMIRHAEFFSYATIKLEAGSITNSIDIIKNEWENSFPDYQLDLHFFDKEFERLYKSENQFTKILSAFSILAILISCIGLFGLTSYYAESYKKISGIRIVFGAGRRELFKYYIYQFLKWQIIGIVLGIISSYFILDYWLEKFAFRTNISGLGIIISSLLVLSISFTTIIYHAAKLARENPADVLRNE